MLQGLEHGVCGALSFLNGQQVAHDLHQTGVVAFLHPLAQASLNHADELLQVGKTDGKNEEMRMLFSTQNNEQILFSIAV